MRALYLGRDGLVYRDDYPAPRVGSGEALIRVVLAGICTTDLEVVKGYSGFSGILGHEFVGIVEHSDDKDWVGRRVVGQINIGCGACPKCIGHGSEHCPNRSVLGIIDHDGAFADYITLPVANLLEVPDIIEDSRAVFTEPLAAALRIREQITIRPSSQAAVVGPGRLGMLVGQVLALGGTRVTMVGRRQRSLALAAQLGLDTALVDDLDDNSFDLVVEATGNDAGIIHSLRLVRPLGTLVLKSTFAGQASVNLTKLVVDEISVIGSRCGPFAPALRLLAQDAIQVVPMIEAEYKLAQGLAAFEHAARPRIFKVLLCP